MNTQQPCIAITFNNESCNNGRRINITKPPITSIVISSSCNTNADDEPSRRNSQESDSISSIVDTEMDR